MDDKQTVGASYIVNFYELVSKLTLHYSNYFNAVLEIENYKDDSDNLSLDEGQKEAFKTYVNNVRYFVHAVYITYNAIRPHIGHKTNELKELYDAINKEYAINRTTLESYVIAVNSLLLDSVVQTLLQTSENIINSIYDNEPGRNTADNTD